MNLIECERVAKDIGFNKAKFTAIFPVGVIECQWVDAYMGLFKIDFDGLRDGFVTVKQINRDYPYLVCTTPYIDGE